MRRFLRNPRILVPVAAILFLALGGGAYALFHDSKPIANSYTSVKASTPAQPLNQTAHSTSTETQSGDCTKDVSDTTNSTGTNVSNNSSTNINCDSSSSDGDNSVNITNNSSQTATSGNSDGTTGTASNNDSTNIHYNN